MAWRGQTAAPEAAVVAVTSMGANRASHYAIANGGDYYCHVAASRVVLGIRTGCIVLRCEGVARVEQTLGLQTLGGVCSQQRDPCVVLRGGVYYELLLRRHVCV